MTRILADTGFLVALFHPADRLAPSARSYLSTHRHPLATVAPVIVETCFFLSGAEKAELLDWAQRGGVAVVETPIESYTEIAAIITRYADRDIDLADADRGVGQSACTSRSATGRPCRAIASR